MRLSLLPRILHRGVCALAVTGLLAGCAPGSMSTQAQRIGVDDGMDSCRRELVTLDSTGNFFGEDIVKGAVVGALGGALIGGLVGGGRGAAIGALAGAAAGASGGYLSALQNQQRDQAGMFSQAQSDLQAEGIQIDKTQLAFDQLTDCRFMQAQAVQAAYAVKRLTRAEAEQQMAVVRTLAQRDIALARLINEKINGRAEQFEVAAERLSPGTKTVLASRSQGSRTVVLRRPAAVKLTPNANAPDLAQVRARERVTVQSTRGEYALIETPSGTRGYAPIASLQGALPRDGTAVAGGDPVRSLAGSNAARRDSFAQSVAVTETAAATSFQVAG